MTAIGIGLAATSLNATVTALAKAIQTLYGAAGDFNDFLDRHIEEMKGHESPVIARTGRVLEATKYGFGIGYLSSTIVIATGQFLLGNTLNAMVTLGTAATLTNPIAMTCAAVGAVYYGWNALSERERNDILARLSEGLATGIELIKSVLRFVIDKTKELLSPKNIEEFKKFIAAGAEVFGRTLGDVTHRIADVVSDTFDTVKKKSGVAIEKSVDAASEAYRAASDGAENAVGQIRSKLKGPGKILGVDESFVPMQESEKLLVLPIAQETVVEIVTKAPVQNTRVRKTNPRSK